MKHTDQQVQEMVKYCREHPETPYAELARMYNMHRASIKHHLKRAGAYVPRPIGSRHPVTPEEAENIRNDYLGGMTTSAISRKYNRTYATIHKHVQDLPKGPEHRGKNPRLCKVWYKGLKEAEERLDGDSIFTDKEFIEKYSPKHAAYCEAQGYVDSGIQKVQEKALKVKCVGCGAETAYSVARSYWVYVRIPNREAVWPREKEGMMCPICFDAGRYNDDKRKDESAETTDGREDRPSEHTGGPATQGNQDDCQRPG